MFFVFFWAANVSDISRSQLWNMELDFGWTRYKAEHKSWRSLLFKVFHCVCHIFSCVFWQASHKKLKKNQASKKKNSNLEFCWIKRTPKNKCARQLWDIGFIFFSLINVMHIKRNVIYCCDNIVTDDAGSWWFKIFVKAKMWFGSGRDSASLSSSGRSSNLLCVWVLPSFSKILVWSPNLWFELYFAWSSCFLSPPAPRTGD